MASKLLFYDLSSLGELARGISHPGAMSDYVHHRFFSKNDLDCIMRDEISRISSSAISGAGIGLSGGGLEAFGFMSPLPWDSEHFGRKMMRLHCFCPGKAEPGGVSEMIARILGKEGSYRAFEHVYCELGIDQNLILDALLGFGFRIMDIKKTFIAKKGLRFSINKNYGFTARDYRPDDYEDVMQIFSSRNFSSRYGRDDFFPKEKVQDVYRIWAQKIISAPEQSRFFKVVERDGVVVSAGGIERIDFVSAGVNAAMLGRGVFASLPAGTGSYMAVLRALIESGWESGYSLLETKVSLSNLSANRVLEKMGATSAMSTYALHFQPHRYA